MTLGRPTATGLGVIALASLASVATSPPPIPSWDVTEAHDLAPFDIAADASTRFHVETFVEYPDDADLHTIELRARFSVLADVDDPALTIEIREAQTDTLLASRTRRGEERSFSLVLTLPGLEEADCALEAGVYRCAHALVVQAQVDAAAELSGQISLSASGLKESFDDPDPDVLLDLHVEAAEDGD